MSTNVSKNLFLRRSALGLFAIALLVLVTLPAHAGPVIDFVKNGSFETLATGNTLVPAASGGAGGYFCQNSGNGTCISNVANWGSTCQGTSCGTSGTPDAILFGGTGGSAFNGFGLYTNGTTGLATNSPLPNSPSGGNFVAFDGDPAYNATISQTLTGLTPGATYVLSFYQAAAQQQSNSGTTTEDWKVTFAGQSQTSTVMNNASKGWVAWNQVFMEFTAGSTGTEVLSFLSQGTPAGQPPVVLLDGVSLTASPEPQSLALVGLGLVAIPLLAQRRKRRA